MKQHEEDEEEFIRNYPFLQYINEDKSRYKHAKDCGYDDPDDLFLIGDSGGFLLNINKDDKFVNTHLFTQMADYYRENHCYTNLPEDSIPHRQLRMREEYRRKHGFTAPCYLHNGKVQNVRITGDHYNFLNYTLIKQLDTKSLKNGNNVGKKVHDFSKFIDAQFWTHHCDEFARRNGFNFIIDKTRRGGFSYIMAAKTANRINLSPHSVVINVAIDKKYLTQTGGLTDFTIANLNFYETNTFFKRGIVSRDDENFILGFKLPNGTVSPKSWNSAVISVSAMNNPDCAIGKDAVEVNVEELSTMDNFDEFMTVTEPAMRTGSYVTGHLSCWGTATSGNMQTFEENFYAPASFKFMPFENVWDVNKRSEVCGYFKSYAWGLQGEYEGEQALDEDGNSDLEVALKIAFRERKEVKDTAKSFADYINYLGQYALMPCESFNSTTENIFSSEELDAWEQTLRTDKAYKFYNDGWLYENNGKVEFKTNARIRAEGGIFNKDYFDWIEGVPRKNHEHHHGCIRKWFSPIKCMYPLKDGTEVMGTPPGLYSISYDPVGINKENKLLTNKHSHNSIKVWMNPSPYNGFKTLMVCAYFGRPEKLEEADRVCLLLAKYYNCIGTTAVEVNRGETVSNFTKWKALKYLMKDPVELWDNSLKGKVTSTYGISIGDSARKLEGLRLLKEMLYSVVGKNDLGEDVYLYQTIYDYQSILELKKWNNVANFDRVSEMIIRAVEWKFKDMTAAKELATRKKVVQDKNHILKRSWY